MPVPDDPRATLVAAGVLLAPEVDGDVLEEATANFGIDASAGLATRREGDR
ncbi:MAG: hypothetical protein ACRD1K_04385 [Acidimicrobiales bacterium]